LIKRILLAVGVLLCSLGVRAQNYSAEAPAIPQNQWYCEAAGTGNISVKDCETAGGAALVASLYNVYYNGHQCYANLAAFPHNRVWYQTQSGGAYEYSISLTVTGTNLYPGQPACPDSFPSQFYGFIIGSAGSLVCGGASQAPGNQIFYNSCRCPVVNNIPTYWSGDFWGGTYGDSGCNVVAISQNGPSVTFNVPNCSVGGNAVDGHATFISSQNATTIAFSGRTFGPYASQSLLTDQLGNNIPVTWMTAVNRRTGDRSIWAHTTTNIGGKYQVTVGGFCNANGTVQYNGQVTSP
jgi:hypothetical protein